MVQENGQLKNRWALVSSSLAGGLGLYSPFSQPLRGVKVVPFNSPKHNEEFGWHVAAIWSLLLLVLIGSEMAPKCLNSLV